MATPHFRKRIYSTVIGSLALCMLSVPHASAQSQTTTGVNPATISYTFTTTYNGANQPSSSSVAVSQTPANADNITGELITYTYQ